METPQTSSLRLPKHSKTRVWKSNYGKKDKSTQQRSRRSSCIAHSLKRHSSTAIHSHEVRVPIGFSKRRQTTADESATEHVPRSRDQRRCPHLSFHRTRRQVRQRQMQKTTRRREERRHARLLVFSKRRNVFQGDVRVSARESQRECRSLRRFREEGILRRRIVRLETRQENPRNMTTLGFLPTPRALTILFPFPEGRILSFLLSEVVLCFRVSTFETFGTFSGEPFGSYCFVFGFYGSAKCRFFLKFTIFHLCEICLPFGIQHSFPQFELHTTLTVCRSVMHHNL